MNIYDEEAAEGLVAANIIRQEMAATEYRTDKIKLMGQYCDALDFIGDPRAELARIAHETGRMEYELSAMRLKLESARAGHPPPDMGDVDAYEKLINDEELRVERLRERGTAILAGIMGAAVDLNPGIGYSVQMNARQFSEHGEEVLTRVPAMPLYFDSEGCDEEQLMQFGSSPLLEGIPTLKLYLHYMYDNDVIRKFFGTPGIRNATDLDVHAASYSFVSMLEGLGNAPNLRRLSFAVNIDEQAVEALAAWPGLRHLKELWINIADGDGLPESLLQALPDDCTLMSTATMHPDIQQRLEAHNQSVHRRRADAEVEIEERRRNHKARMQASLGGNASDA